MSDIAFTLEDDGTNGRYFAPLPQGGEAVLTYRHDAEGVIAIDHTGVPSQYRGQGIARKLVDFALADIRTRGLKVIPQCSYVEAEFERDPALADLLA